MEAVEISIVKLAGGGHCTASEDGQKVHDRIKQLFYDNKSVCLSFKGVEDLTSAFLNTAIGQLYGEFEESFIKMHLSILESDISKDDLFILKRVVDRAKEFFKDSDNERYVDAVEDALGGGSVR